MVATRRSSSSAIVVDLDAVATLQHQKGASFPPIEEKLEQTGAVAAEEARNKDEEDEDALLDMLVNSMRSQLGRTAGSGAPRAVAGGGKAGEKEGAGRKGGAKETGRDGGSKGCSGGGPTSGRLVEPSGGATGGVAAGAGRNTEGGNEGGVVEEGQGFLSVKSREEQELHDLEKKVERLRWVPETGLLRAAKGPVRSDRGRGAPLVADAATLTRLGGGGRKVLSKASKGELRVPGVLEKEVVAPPRDHRREERARRKEAAETAGKKWFHLPATTITPDLKRELNLIKLRGFTDPKRFYKSADSKSLPKYFQVGTVVQGPADFYSGRLTRRERKKTITEELLADTQLKTYRKRKYAEIQQQKQSGGRGYLKERKNKRRPSWKRD